MFDMQSIYMDAQDDVERKKHNEENGLIYIDEASGIANEEQFIQYCIEVIDDYNIDNYLEEIDIWNSLPELKKLEYCYNLLTEDPDDNFPIFRQVDVFQKLVNLDFKKFSYYRVLECAFFDKIYDGVNLSSTITIPYNPLIPKKYYDTYIKKLKKKCAIGHLQIPIDNATDYLKELLHIWFLVKHKKLTAYKIADKFGDIDNQKKIARKIKAIKKIVSYSQTKIKNNLYC